jgi:abortive infection bacteriophage resistance protein
MPNSFNKPALQPNDLIQKMVARGLYVDDRQQAQDYLTKVGYYRLSGYTLLLETAGSFATNSSGTALYQRTHVFRSGASFQELIDLYDVDRYLRLYLLDAIERIEVSFRTILSDHMTLKYANPH